VQSRGVTPDERLRFRQWIYATIEAAAQGPLSVEWDVSGGWRELCWILSRLAGAEASGCRSGQPRRCAKGGTALAPLWILPDIGGAARSGIAVGEWAVRRILHTGCSPVTYRNEFPTGYSLAGCSPALPASASPVALILNRKQLVRQQFPANGNCSLLPLSQFTAQSN
jgi:hypothetical protein